MLCFLGLSFALSLCRPFIEASHTALPASNTGCVVSVSVSLWPSSILAGLPVCLATRRQSQASFFRCPPSLAHPFKCPHLQAWPHPASLLPLIQDFLGVGVARRSQSLQCMSLSPDSSSSPSRRDSTLDRPYSHSLTDLSSILTIPVCSCDGSLCVLARGRCVAGCKTFARSPSLFRARIAWLTCHRPTQLRSPFRLACASIRTPSPFCSSCPAKASFSRPQTPPLSYLLFSFHKSTDLHPHPRICPCPPSRARLFLSLSLSLALSLSLLLFVSTSHQVSRITDRSRCRGCRS